MTKKAKAYIDDVVRGKVPTGKFTRLAVERHLKDIERSKKKDFPYIYDEKTGALPIQFIESECHHYIGEYAGQKIVLEPWQHFNLSCIFGWIHKKTGLRRFRRAYIKVARKNGKSTMVSGLGLYGLIADGEPGAEVYSSAVKKDQARIIFDAATQMVRRSPLLANEIQSFRNSLVYPPMASKFEPLSSDVKSLDGLSTHFGLIDELHAHPTREVWDVLDTSTGARRQPLIFTITTAGIVFQNSIDVELDEYMEKVLQGIFIDDTFYGIKYALDTEDDFTNERVWIKANPNLDVSVKRSDLREKVERAINSPASQANIKTKHFNIPGTTHLVWLDIGLWDACQKEFDLASLRGKPCFGGLDLSSTRDLSSLSLVFPYEDSKGSKRYKVLWKFWCPEENIFERAKKDRVQYPLWRDQGFLTATEGNVVDYAFITYEILEAHRQYNIKELAYDPWNAIQTVSELVDEGLPMVEVRQGFASMSGPIKHLETIIVSQALEHLGDPVARWNFSNIALKTDPAGNVKFDKQKSKEKIDGMLALVMAISRTMAESAKPSVYETRGPIIV